MKSLNVLYYSEPARGKVWQEKITALYPDIQFHVWTDSCDLESMDVLVVWKIPENFLQKLPNLKAIFTVSAGIDQIDFSVIPQHVDVVRMIDNDLSQQMAEYAAMSVLMLYRRALDYLQQQESKQWQPLSVKPPQQMCIGVMGLGKQGQKIVQQLMSYQFQLKGWSRSLHHIDGVDCFDDSGLSDFLSGLDILLCVLPLTEQTKGILNQDLFAKLPAGCSMINIGRGEHLVEEDLLAALSTGQIDRAILDVTTQEPPSADNPLWMHPKVMLTPHVAGVTRAEAAFDSISQSLINWHLGQKPEGLIERKRGY